MGLLSKLLPIAGAVVGNAILPGIGGQIGGALGGAAGGALSKSSGSKKATAAQLQAIEDAKKQLTASKDEALGYQAPGLATYAPGVNALTQRLGVSRYGAPPTYSAAPANGAPANALTSGPPLAGNANGATWDGQPYGPQGDPTKMNGGFDDTGSGFAPGFSPAAAPSDPNANPPANALVPQGGVVPVGGVDPGTYGDTSLGGAPASYQAPQTPGAFSYTLDDYKSSPGYQWQQDQARKGMLAGASATGALQSGAAVKELQDRAQNIAYQDFGQERAFALGLNRDQRTDFNNDRSFDYGQSRDARSDYQDTRNYLTQRFDTGTNDLFRYTGIGQAAANNSSAAAARYGDQIAGLITDGGQAKASNALTQGGIGADLANSLGGTLSGLFGGGGATNFLKTPNPGSGYGQPGAASYQIFG